MIVRVGNFVILALQNYTKLSINYKITIKTNPPMTEFRRFSIHQIMIFFWVPFISPISFIQKDELVNGFPYWENLSKPGVYIFASAAARMFMILFLATLSRSGGRSVTMTVKQIIGCYLRPKSVLR